MLAPLAEIRRLAQVVVEEQRGELGRTGQGGLAVGEALAPLRPGRSREDLWIPLAHSSHSPWFPTDFFVPRLSRPWRERHSFPHPWRERYSPLLMHLVEPTSAAEAAAEVAAEAA